MTPQELKNSILQLAIQGKLVEQRPEEGTGEELYREIQREKQRLIEAGKIKKEKPLPEIAEEEKPFEIPESWMWVRLEACGSWNAGATPPRTNLEYYNGTIPWLKTGDLNDGIINEIPEFITEKALDDTSVRLNPIGSVLMAMYGATIGKLGILGIAATTNQACCACIPFEGIYNKYLFYFLMASRLRFIKMGEGGAQPNISKDKILRFAFCLPPYAEQKRIVAKIEELLPFIDRYEQAWNRLETFNKRFPEDMKKSILQLAIQGKLVEQRPEEGTGEELYCEIQREKQRLIEVGKIKKGKPLPEIMLEEKPFEIPESWAWVRMGNLLQVISGVSYKKGDVSDKGLRVLRGGNIQNGRILLEDTDVFLPSTYYDSERQVQKCDILIVASTGSKEVIGKAGYVDREMPNTMIGAFLRICRPYMMCIERYLRYVFEGTYYRQHIRKLSQGTNINNVKESYITEFLIPLPPLAEQKRIVAKLEELLPLCNILK